MEWPFARTLTWQRGIALGLLAIAAALAGAIYLLRGEIALLLMQRTLEQNFAGGALLELPDGLHVGLCGAGSPLPDPGRGGPCVVVIAGRRIFVVDAGGGASRTLARMGFQLGDVERVFLTHFHSDHIDGLGELMLQRWIGAANDKPLPIHGPQGVERVVEGFNAAYTLDSIYRVAHHGTAVVPAGGFGGLAVTFSAGEGVDEVTILQDVDLTVTAFRVVHEPVEPAVGYRISYKGRTAVISGDTAKSSSVAKAAKGADLLVHEALSPRLVGMIEAAAQHAGRSNLAEIMRDIVGYHSTPEQAAEIARDARVKYLLLYHITPPLPLSALEGPFLGRASEIFTGRIRLGRDGDLVSMPAGSKSLETVSRLPRLF